jgi:hypothetical protein
MDGSHAMPADESVADRIESRPNRDLTQQKMQIRMPDHEGFR